MLILIPMDSDNKEHGRITSVAEAKAWAQLRIEEGELKELLFHERYDGFPQWSEAVVVNHDGENVMPFLEMSMMPLVAHTQKSINEIVEAYLFRELHDLAY